MGQRVTKERRRAKWRVRQISALVSFVTVALVSLAFALGDWASSKARGMHSSTNQYFRYGDPTPLSIPMIHTGMGFNEFERDPCGGKWFDVGLEWRPKTGAFDDIKAGPGENSPYMYTVYHLRPEYLHEFRSDLDQAFGNEPKQTGAKPEDEIWPDVRGYRLSLCDGNYSVVPLDADDVGFFKFFNILKQCSIAAGGFCMLYVTTSFVLRKRFKRQLSSGLAHN